MIWHLIRYMLSATIPLFYKRLQIKNAKNLRIKGPAILALNHPNAFMDPVAFSLLAYPPRVKYLARGDAFKPGIVSLLLEWIGIVPIFRIQDGGREGLKKNNETYRRVNQLLFKNKKIIIFAEGLCVQERRLRSIKKGVPRMIFGAMEEINRLDLLVIPVGVNYNKPKKFRSNLFFNVGNPIKVADFMDDYKKNPARTMNQFIQILEPKMKELIVHINNPKNDLLIEHLEELLKRDLCKQQKLNYKNLEHDLIITKQITETINSVEEKNPEALNELRKKCNNYFKTLSELKLRDWIINPKNKSKTGKINLFNSCVILLAGFPLYAIGHIGNYLPYKLSKILTDKIAKNVEFHSSINLALGSFLFVFYYLLQFFVFYLFSDHLGWPLLYIIIALFTGWFSLYYHPLKQKTMGVIRSLKNKTEIEKLRKNREELVFMYNEFNKF